MMEDSNGRRIPWALFASELIGTALLVLVGLSLVIFMFGAGTPMARLIPSEGLRRLITGFLFGTTGACIALSPVGKVSGAHINPVVTLAFRLMGKLDVQTTLGYIVAQLMGAVVGSLPLLLWGEMGKSVAFGATLPGSGATLWTVFLGEVITTFMMVALLAVFLGFRTIRPFTPAIFPPLYAIMVWAEAPISGTSTNPARSLGPSVISGQWQDWWIYWIGPMAGMLLAVIACSFLAKRIEVAKLYYFESDRDRLFRRMNKTSPVSMALAVLVALSMGLSSCAQGPITLDRPQDKVMESKPDGKDLKILQAWSGDYPLAELGRLPADQAKERVGYIGDKVTFAAVWQAMSSSLALPEVDFTSNIVVFCRNTVFYNRTSIARVVLKDGIVEVLAMETMSSLPIEDKVAMAMAVISRSGVKFMQTGSGLIPVMKEPSSGPLDTFYRIEGQKVLLSHGYAQVDSVPGSMTKGTVSVFGKPVSGDLDGDGNKDAALILVYKTGGSGTFYYVAACLNMNGTYEGTNAVLLGDRIALHDSTVQNGVIVINYAERGPEEPMTAPPSKGMTKTLRVKDLTLAGIKPLE